MKRSAMLYCTPLHRPALHSVQSTPRVLAIQSSCYHNWNNGYSCRYACLCPNRNASIALCVEFVPSQLVSKLFSGFILQNIWSNTDMQLKDTVWQPRTLMNPNSSLSSTVIHRDLQFEDRVKTYTPPLPTEKADQKPKRIVTFFSVTWII